MTHQGNVPDEPSETGAKKRNLHDIVTVLPGGQRRVVLELVAGDDIPTYREVARRLGLSVGTVYTHLKRVRDGKPDVYKVVMAERRRQLDDRHAAAIKKACERSRRYLRGRANWIFYERFGRWPWESR